jgi:hypothetical protein
MAEVLISPRNPMRAAACMVRPNAWTNQTRDCPFLKYSLAKYAQSFTSPSCFSSLDGRRTPRRRWRGVSLWSAMDRADSARRSAQESAEHAGAQPIELRLGIGRGLDRRGGCCPWSGSAFAAVGWTRHRGAGSHRPGFRVSLVDMKGETSSCRMTMPTINSVRHRRVLESTDEP